MRSGLTNIFQYVETKNLTLEQIDTLFEGGTVTTGVSTWDGEEAKMENDVRVIETYRKQG